MPWRFNPFTGNLDETDIPAFTGEVTLGSAASPSIFFTGDPNTGIYSPGTDQVAISTNGTGRLFVDSSGRVAINPSASDASDRRLLIRGAGAGDGAILLKSSSTPDGTSRGFLVQSFGASSDAYVWQLENSPLIFGTNATERLRITSDGKVGLGTSSPSRTLDVIGTARVTSVLTMGSWIQGTTQLDLYGDSSSSSGVRLDSSGRLGVGTTSPGFPLHVKLDQGSTTNIAVENASGGSGAYTQFRVVGDSGIGYFGYSGSGSGGSGAYEADYVYVMAENSASGLNIGAAAGPIRFFANGTSAASERARIDSSGRLLVGTSTARVVGLVNGGLQLSGDVDKSSVTLSNYANDAQSARLSFGKSRGTSDGVYTIVQNGDRLGVISFSGADGTDLGTRGAVIEAYVDGTPGANDMPGRLVFSTTADGASSPTERMRITNDGRILLGTTTGDSGLVVDRTVSRVALGTTAPARIYTGAGTITDNTTAASGTVAHGTIVSFDNPAIAATNASVTYTRASTLYVDGAPTAGTNVTIANRYGLFVNAGNSVFGENVTVGGAVVPASATASLTLINGTIPSASVVNGVSLYAEDVSASSELKVRDEAGNITTLSPHNFSLIPEGPSEEMSWAFYSERDGKKINVDMLKAIRLLEQLSGEQLVYLSDAL